MQKYTLSFIMALSIGCCYTGTSFAMFAQNSALDRMPLLGPAIQHMQDNSNNCCTRCCMGCGACCIATVYCPGVVLCSPCLCSYLCYKKCRDGQNSVN